MYTFLHTAKHVFCDIVLLHSPRISVLSFQAWKMRYKLSASYLACMTLTVCCSYYLYNDLLTKIHHYHILLQVPVKEVHSHHQRSIANNEDKLHINRSIPSPNKLYIELEPQLKNALSKATEHVNIFLA